MDFACFDLENNTTSNIYVDDNIEGLEEYITNQKSLENFISIQSISSGNFTKISASNVSNKIGWITINRNANVSYEQCGMNGTAFLIAPDIIVTAAHCIHDGDDAQSYFNTIYFEAGRYSGASVYSCKVEKVFIPEDFLVNGNYNSAKDFAVLKLSNPIGNYPSIGYEEIAIPTTGLEGNSITLKGYPGIPDNTNYEYQFYSTGTLTKVNTTTIEYNASSSGGMSGCPIYDNASGDVIGIHNGPKWGAKITGAIYRFTMLDFDESVELG